MSCPVLLHDRAQGHADALVGYFRAGLERVLDLDRVTSKAARSGAPEVPFGARLLNMPRQREQLC